MLHKYKAVSVSVGLTLYFLEMMHVWAYHTVIRVCRLGIREEANYVNIFTVVFLATLNLQVVTNYLCTPLGRRVFFVRVFSGVIIPSRLTFSVIN